MAFGDFQNEIYLQGLAGNAPGYPVAFDALERAAREVMTPEAVGYVAGAAGAERTVAANAAAFDRWRILPRMLRGVVERDLSTTLFGGTLPAPVLLAPVGVLEIVHADRERAVARAAAAAGVPMVLSTVSSTPLEEVAAELGDNPGWFQLYWPRERELAASLVQRAERAGFRAIVVTLDTWMLGWRPRDLTAGYLPFLTAKGLANYLTDPVFTAGLPADDRNAAVLKWITSYNNPALTWADLAWLRERTTLPIVLKGICAPDDARAAVDSGVDGLVVSNHGGRQVDGAVGTLDVLPEVVAAVGDRLPVLVDSGVRTGADVVKAVALGARAVLLGRPYVWGLGLGGEAGVRHVLRCLLADTDLTLGLAGYRSLTELTPEALVRA